MRQTKTKSPRAGDKERMKLPSAEDSRDSPSKKLTQIKRVYECKTCGLQFDSRRQL